MKLKLLSLNLAGYLDWSDRKDNVVELINKLGADLVLFQEVKYDAKFAPSTQSVHINSLLNAPYKFHATDVTRFHVPEVGEPYREGLSTLSRYPIMSVETIALNKPNDDEHVRIVQDINIDIDGQTVKFVNVHFSHNKYSTSHLEEVMAMLERRNETGIIVGDYNIVDINGQRKVFEDKYTISTDVFTYVSFPPKGIAIDYMLLPKPYKFIDLETFDDVSDHRALLFTLKI